MSYVNSTQEPMNVSWLRLTLELTLIISLVLRSKFSVKRWSFMQALYAKSLARHGFSFAPPPHNTVINFSTQRNRVELLRLFGSTRFFWLLGTRLKAYFTNSLGLLLFYHTCKFLPTHGDACQTKCILIEIYSFGEGIWFHWRHLGVTKL